VRSREAHTMPASATAGGGWGGKGVVERVNKGDIGWRLGQLGWVWVGDQRCDWFARMVGEGLRTFGNMYGGRIGRTKSRCLNSQRKL